MLIFTQRLATSNVEAGNTETKLADLLLDHEQRRRVRAKLQLVDGTPITLALPRGTVLHAGERLVTEAGDRTTVRAALEHVCTAVVDDLHHLARIAYHLGNRHVAVQFAGNAVYFLYSPALTRLCEGLGARVEEGHLAFEPEVLGTAAHGHDHEHIDGDQASN